MRAKLTGEIALALLLARWKQTLVAAIGVTFSISMFIALLSFMTGLNGLLDGLILNRTPHILLYNEIQPNPIQPVARYMNDSFSYHFIHSVKPRQSLLRIRNESSIQTFLKEDHRVLGVAPKLVSPVIYNAGAINLNGLINGIDVYSEDRLFFFSDYVTKGKATDLMNVTNSIIIGKGLADVMLLKLGDLVSVTTAHGSFISLKVVGFYQSGLLDIDKVQSFVSINTCQKLLGESVNYITDIQVKLKDVTMAPIIAKEYKKLFQVDAIDIQSANAQYETGSFIRSLISYVVGITLLIVAGFGIYNILNMLMYEKMDSIAILKATGFSGKDVKIIFIKIALSIGIFGGALGLIFGLGLSFLIGNIPFETASLPLVKTYPVTYNPIYYVIGIVFSIVTTFLAGYFPARKASKVDPVTIIRGK